MTWHRDEEKRAVFILKTSVGGMWIIPQIHALEEKGYSCAVIIPPAPGRLRQALADLQVEVIDSPFDFRFGLQIESLRGLYALRRLIQRLRPSVLIYHLYASAIAVRVASFAYGVPRVHMVAGPLYLESRFIRFAEGFLRGLDTLLVSGSAYTWTAYEGLLGIEPAIHRILPYGVDTHTFTPKDLDVRNKVRASMGVDEDVFVVIMVAYTYAPKASLGKTVGVKGHENLLDAWRLFGEVNPGISIRLVVVGAGFDVQGEEHRQRLISDSPMSVDWIDTVSDVRGYYAAADVSVSPSLSENHGAVLEAGATGTPAIVSDAGGLPETVNASTGWVFNRNNVWELVDGLNQALREKLDGTLRDRGERSREFVSAHYDSKASAAKFAELVEGTASAGEPPSWKFVTEARFLQFGDGSVVSLDHVNGDKAWCRYSSQVPRVLVAGRSSASQVYLGGDPLNCAQLYSLVSYSGVRGLVLATPRLVAQLCRYVRLPGLLIVRLPGPLSLVAAFCALVLRRPYAVELVGDVEGVLHSGVSATPSWVWPGIVHATRLVVRKASAVRYVTRHSLQESFPAGEVPTVSVSNVLLRAEEFAPKPKAAPSEGGWRLFSVGSQENSYKGYDELIRALKNVVEHGFPVTLTIVGEGSYQSNLRVLAKDLGVESLVTFEGLVERERLLALLRDSDIYVQPSRTEGLPRALVEAMAQALPVVGTDVGGIPELVDQEFLVPPGDALKLTAAIEKIMVAPVWRFQSRRSLEVAALYGRVHTDRAFGQWFSVLRDLGGGIKPPRKALFRRLLGRLR